MEDYKLHKINANTHSKNTTNLKMLEKEAFTRKPINKVSRIEIVNYLNKLAEYSPTTIKERFRIIKRAFDCAYSQNIIKDNYMDGYNAVEKPKTKVNNIVPKKIALTLDKERQVCYKMLENSLLDVELKKSIKIYFYCYLQQE